MGRRREHGVAARGVADARVGLVLREAWEAGVVLCGVSAGMNCWFEGSTTDSFDLTRLAALEDGLGLLPGSCCPHYDGEEQRRPLYRRLVADGVLAPGYAADDAAALVFEGTSLAEVVTHGRGARPRTGSTRRVEERSGRAAALTNVNGGWVGSGSGRGRHECRLDRAVTAVEVTFVAAGAVRTRSLPSRR